MSLIVVANERGKSRIVKKEPFKPAGAEFVSMRLFEHSPLPPTIAGGTSSLLDMHLAPGQLRWTRVSFPPGQGSPMHFTHSIDCDTIIEGSVVLVLDDGEHPLGVGDVVVIEGVDHGWRAGPAGCTMSVFCIGARVE